MKTQLKSRWKPLKIYDLSVQPRCAAMVKHRPKSRCPPPRHCWDGRLRPMAPKADLKKRCWFKASQLPSFTSRWKSGLSGLFVHWEVMKYENYHELSMIFLCFHLNFISLSKRLKLHFQFIALTTRESMALRRVGQKGDVKVKFSSDRRATKASCTSCSDKKRRADEQRSCRWSLSAISSWSVHDHFMFLFECFP